MGRLVFIIGLAGVLLGGHVTRAAAGVVLDPLCVQACQDDNCSGDSRPSQTFMTCTDTCGSKFTTCPALSHCFVKCDQQRADYAVRCQVARTGCIRNHCRVLTGRARPAVVVSPCVQQCSAARPACLRSVGKALRHCSAKCKDSCGDFPYQAAIDDCRGVCRGKYQAISVCDQKLRDCKSKCGGGS